jgi:hypothetical protein
MKEGRKEGTYVLRCALLAPKVKPIKRQISGPEIMYMRSTILQNIQSVGIFEYSESEFNEKCRDNESGFSQKHQHSKSEFNKKC